MARSLVARALDHIPPTTPISEHAGVYWTEGIRRKYGYDYRLIDAVRDFWLNRKEHGRSNRGLSTGEDPCRSQDPSSVIEFGAIWRESMTSFDYDVVITGAVINGPAMMALNTYKVQEVDGRVCIRI